VCFRDALSSRPHDACALAALAHARRYLCDWDGPQEPEIAAACAATGLTSPIPPFTFLCLSSSPVQQLACARQWATRQLGPFVSARTDLRFAFSRESKARLRIGYLSADFHEHATAYLVAETLRSA